MRDILNAPGCETGVLIGPEKDLCRRVETLGKVSSGLGPTNKPAAARIGTQGQEREE